MGYFNSQWQSGKLFCCSHFSKSSCWLFVPLSILLNVLLVRNISMRICRELWPVPPSCNWARCFFCGYGKNILCVCTGVRRDGHLSIAPNGFFQPYFLSSVPRASSINQLYTLLCPTQIQSMILPLLWVENPLFISI